MVTINNFINNIKNNHITFKHFLKYPASNLILEICNLFLIENFIRGYFIEKKNGKNIVVILLRYNMNKKTFQQMFYKERCFKFKQLKKNSKFINGLGFNVISTSKGLTTHSKALHLKLGGQTFLQIF